MAKISLEFADNNLISTLATPPYSWLSAIAEHLQIKIFQRGNQIILEGNKKSCEMAANCLQKLYDSAQEGDFLKENMPVMAFDESVGMPHNHAPHSHDAINNAHHLNQSNLQSLLDSLGTVASTTDKVRKAVPHKKTPKANHDSYQPDSISLKGKILQSRNQAQQLYMDAINSHTLTLGVGPAGTGKTHLAVACGIKLLLEEKISQIILTRPVVEAGERLGYLPGDMRDKIDPYFQPVYDSLYEFLGKEHTEGYLSNGKISLAPLAYMRGRTLKNAFIILDEAQNTTIGQMKLFLTRLGEGSQMVINGDLSQIDLPKPHVSGLKDAILRLKNINNIAICHFSIHDSVRNPLVNEILTAYQTQDNGEKDTDI